MPKGQYQRKRRARVPETKTVTFESGTPIDMGKVAPDLPQQTSPAAPQSDAVFQEQVLGLLQSMSGAIAKLNERVDAVEHETGPKFVPMQRDTFGNEPSPHERWQLAEMAPTDSVPRSQTIPITSDGLRVPELMLDEHPARYGSGSRVRLNLDVVPHGRTDGKRRGELMMERDVPNAPGVVIDRQYLSRARRADGRRGVWKYRCQFPQAVMPGSNLGIVSLHEPELMPA